MNDESKVVVHYTDGKLAKGYAFDFNQDRNTFYLYTDQTKADMIEVTQNDLKAVFFVKTFDGNPKYNPPEMSVDETCCKNLKASTGQGRFGNNPGQARYRLKYIFHAQGYRGCQS